MPHSDVTDGRSRLIDAARAEIVERGVEALSLRSIARRAGLSNAAPGYFFGDRAGMLTAVATEGFHALSAVLRASGSADGALTVSGLGRAYVAFGLEYPELFTLMFRPAVLRPDDPELLAASAAAIGLLSSAIAGADDPPIAGAPPQLALVGWALAHGLIALAREGALQNVTGADPLMLSGELLDVFEARTTRSGAGPLVAPLDK